MKQLIAATLIWAFSFSLIGEYLSGEVDPYWSAWIRISLAMLFFLPFACLHRIDRPKSLKLITVGAIQLGMMYVFYFKSFEILTVPEVLLFTTLTPLYISIIQDFWSRHFRLRHFAVAFMAVAGALVIRWGNTDTLYLQGILLVQLCNLCFALGQLTYRNWFSTPNHSHFQSFFYFFLGAWVVSGLALILMGSPKLPNASLQWAILIWLGLVASGVGYYLWNRGTTTVDTGTLAVMNNLLIPAGLLVNLAIWNHEASMIKLTIGGGIIVGSLYLNVIWRKSEQSKDA